MSEISVPYTCPYIDQMLVHLRFIEETVEEEIEVLEGNGWGAGGLARVEIEITKAIDQAEIVREMNSEIRAEGDVFAQQSDEYEEEVEEWQEIATHAAERIEELEDKLFDIEKERDKWQEFELTPVNLLIGSS